MGVADTVGTGVITGSEVSVGVGEGAVDGVTDGLGVAEATTPRLARAGNCCTLVPWRMGAIIHVKTRAGIEPPVIPSKPPNGLMASAEPLSPTW